MKQKKLSKKIATIVTAVLTLAFAVLIGALVFLSDQAISKSIENAFRNLAQSNGNQIQAILDSASTQAESIQDYMNGINERKGQAASSDTAKKSQIYPSEISGLGIEAEAYLLNNLWCALKTNEDLIGLGVFFEPWKFDDKIEQYSLYVTQEHAANKTAETEDLYSNYGDSLYYKPVKESSAAFMSKPYVENGITMITASYPILYQGQFMGVVLADINIGRFDHITTQAENFETMGAGILTDDFTIAYDSQSPDAVGQNLSENLKNPEEINPIIESAAAGQPFKATTVNADGKKVARFFYPIDAQGANWWAQTFLEETDMYKGISLLIMVISILVLIILLIIISVVVFVISKALRPINDVVFAANEIAEGNLDTQVEIERDDEIGLLARTFRDMSANLKVIIEDVGYLLGEMGHGNFAVQRENEDRYIGEYQKISLAMTSIIKTLSETLLEIDRASEQVSVGADQVSSAAQDLSQGATEQASSIEELSASLAEISAQIKQTADNAQSANSLSNEAGEGVAESNRQMQEMISAMDHIAKKSNEIGHIIKTIDDIAFQTNILALNAAVEAARAGHTGRGFAVVADEVRNLAQRSAEAAKNTTELIGETIGAVGEGIRIADQTAQSLKQVVEKTILVENRIENIAKASREQTEAILQVNQGVEQISQVVQINSATAEESAAASEELSGQAQMLKELISKFNLPSSIHLD